jgi:hypothetical protein
MSYIFLIFEFFLTTAVLDTRGKAFPGKLYFVARLFPGKICRVALV